MSEVLALTAVAVACWVFRIVFVLLVPAEALPPRVQQSLTYLAPAVLAGIAAAELTSVLSPTDLYASTLAVAAVAVVGVIAYRWRNLTLTVVVGLAAVLVLDLAL